MSVVYLTSDLFFSASVTSHARELGIAVRVVGDQAGVLDAARESGARLVILDLNQRGADLPRLVADLKRLSPPPFVLGYGSHVQEAALSAARAAGCDDVWPRSRFDREMRQLLTNVCGVEGRPYSPN